MYADAVPGAIIMLKLFHMEQLKCNLVMYADADAGGMGSSSWSHRGCIL